MGACKNAGTKVKRIHAIDALRGAVMIIMALDHTREFFHSAAPAFSPEDLSKTTAAIFLTRWITHFCAPVFMFTAGLGAFLWAERHGAGRPAVARFMLTRGLWLVFLELTIARFALYFNFDYSTIALLVLWALGCSMMALAALVYLPVGVLAAVSIAMVAFHNLLDGVRAAQFGWAAWVWNVLHQPGVFAFAGRQVLLAYPLIPWVGVMGAGYCFGRVFVWEPERRRRVLVRTGLGLTTAFVVLRAVNVYGDPARWSVQPSPLFTVLSFVRCTKYPPSLDFLLMTLGPAIAVLPWLERLRLSAVNPLLVFGRVPLFYYVAHLYAIHLIAMLMAWMRYGTAAFLLNPPPGMGGPREAFPPDYGYPLWVCYVVWLVVVGSVYPLCRWFAGLKSRRQDWWLGYL